MIYEAVRLKWLKTCIVVPKKLLANQLADDLQEFNTQVIVWSKPKIEWDIVIMTWATFNKRYDEINWLYPFIILDECHRCPKVRREQIIMRQWVCVLWLTATLKRKEFALDWFKMIYWTPIDTNTQALDVVVYTKKINHYFSIEDYMYASAWLSPDSPEINRNLIVNHEPRNRFIRKLVDQSISKWLKRIIIFTDRVKHIDKIYECFDWLENVFKYYWWTDQVWIKNKCKQLDNFIIIWNVSCCWEWFNVPSLQLWILVVSTQRSVTIDQAVWRVRRTHWDKKYWFLIDIQDSISIWWSSLKSLWSTSRNKIYKEKNWKVLSLPIHYEPDISVTSLPWMDEWKLNQEALL